MFHTSDSYLSIDVGNDEGSIGRNGSIGQIADTNELVLTGLNIDSIYCGPVDVGIRSLNVNQVETVTSESGTFHW
jgi:hypothetical protein